MGLSIHVDIWRGEVGAATAVTEQHCALLHTHTDMKMMMMITSYTYTAMMMMMMIRKYFIGVLDAAVRTVLPVVGSTLQCPLHKLQCG